MRNTKYEIFLDINSESNLSSQCLCVFLCVFLCACECVWMPPRSGPYILTCDVPITVSLTAWEVVYISTYVMRLLRSYSSTLLVWEITLDQPCAWHLMFRCNSEREVQSGIRHTHYVSISKHLVNYLPINHIHRYIFCDNIRSI